MVLYWGDQPLATWTLESAEYGSYEYSFTSWGGVKTVELSLANDPGGVGDVDIVVDYLDIAWAAPPIPVVSTWGMIVFITVLLGIGVMVLLRRRAM